jgi:hypothetical protein
MTAGLLKVQVTHLGDPEVTGGEELAVEVTRRDRGRIALSDLQSWQVKTFPSPP